MSVRCIESVMKQEGAKTQAADVPVLLCRKILSGLCQTWLLNDLSAGAADSSCAASGAAFIRRNANILFYWSVRCIEAVMEQQGAKTQAVLFCRKILSGLCPT